jgi:hypothetical protein
MASMAQTLFPNIQPYFQTPIPYSPTKYTEYKSPLYKPPPPPFDYGRQLAENKGKLLAAVRGKGLPEEYQFLFMAMAMQETETLSEGERDSTKDQGDADAVNFSIFNLNAFFIRQAGATGDYKRLNPHAALPEVVMIILAGIAVLGLERALQTIRGGQTAFINHRAFGAWAYPPALKSSILVMDGMPSLLYDRHRVACNLPHV